MKKEDGKTPSHAATTFRSLFSIFQKYYFITGRGDLKAILPVLYAGFNVWENGYEEKHAKEFSKEQLLALYDLPNTNDTKFWKAYSAAAVSAAFRSLEPHQLQFGFEGAVATYPVSYIRKLEDGTFRIDFVRNKKRSGKNPLPGYAIISGTKECLALSNYIECFPEVPILAGNGQYNGRTGRFWRYLTQNGIATIKPIGIHTCQNVSIAKS